MNVPTKTDAELPALQGHAALVAANSKSSQVGQLEAMVYQAHLHPRDPEKARAEVLERCKSPWLSKNGVYRYERGGQPIHGPSIVLASEISSIWGNFVSGVEQFPYDGSGKISMRAYAWDIEKNRWRFRNFEVGMQAQRVRTVNGERKTVWEDLDARDLREWINNQASREERNCILRTLPGALVQEATEQCELAYDALCRENGVDWDELFKAFAAEGISVEMIEDRFGRKRHELTNDNGIELRRLYTAIKAGDVEWQATAGGDLFTKGGQPNRGHEQAQPKGGGANKKAAKKTKPKAEPKPKQEQSPEDREPEPKPEEEPKPKEGETKGEADPEKAPGCSLHDFNSKERSEVQAYMVGSGYKNEEEARAAGIFDQRSSELLGAARKFLAARKGPDEDQEELW